MGVMTGAASQLRGELSLVFIWNNRRENEESFHADCLVFESLAYSTPVEWVTYLSAPGCSTGNPRINARLLAAL